MVISLSVISGACARRRTTLIASRAPEISFNPNLASLYLNRAEAYFYNRQYARASDDIETARQLSPEDPLVYVMRGKLKLARFEKDEARKDFEKAVSLGFKPEDLEQIDNP